MLHELDDLSNNDLTDSSQDNWSFPDFSKFSNKKIRSRLGRRKLSNNEQKEVTSKTDTMYSKASNGFPWSQLNNSDKFEELPSNCITHPVSSSAGYGSVYGSAPNQCSKPSPNQNTLKDIGNIVKGCTKIHEVKVIDSGDDSSKENIKYILNNSFLCEDTTKTESSCMVSYLSLNSSENKHLYDTLPFKTPVKSFYDDDYLRPCTPNPLDGILDPESDSSFDVGNSCSKTDFLSFDGDSLKTSFTGKNVSGIKKLNENHSPNNIPQSISNQEVKYSHGTYSNLSIGTRHDVGVSPNLDTPDSSVEVPVKSQEIVESQLVLYKSETPISEIKLKDELDKNCKLQLFGEVSKLPSDQSGQLVVYKSPPVVFDDKGKSASDDNDKMLTESTHGVPPSEEKNLSNESIKPVHNFTTNNILAQQNTKIPSCQNVNPTIEVGNKIPTVTPLNVYKQVSKPVQQPLSFLNKTENKHNDFLSNVLFNKHTKTSNDKFSKTPYYFQMKPMVPVGASIKSTLHEATMGSLVPPRVLHLNQADPIKSLQHNSAPSFDKLSSTFEAKSKIDKVSEVKSNSLSFGGNKISPVSVKPEHEKPLNTPSVRHNEVSNVAPLLSRQSLPVSSAVNQPADQPQVSYNLPKVIQDNMMSKGLMSNAINHQEHVTPAQKLSALKLSPPTSQPSNGNDVFKKPFAIPPPPAERAHFNKPNNKIPLNTLLMKEEKPLDSRRPQDIVVNGTTYTTLSVLGRGGSSVVYQVMDPKTSEQMAVKCVDLSSVDGAIANGYLNEVHLLEKLQGCQSVIKMFNYEYIKENKLLYVVMERGDTDLAKLIKDIRKTKQMSMTMIMFYWTEMLSAVKDIHDRGIIHSDLKPANFLLVSGRLKLIDFGIASSLQGDMTSVIKDSTAGTFNYMSPEAINCNSEHQGSHKISYKSDVWSLGCILYSLLFGKSPYSHIGNMWSKLRAIVDPSCHPPYPAEIPFVMNFALRWCLLKDPKRRPTVKQLLSLPYCAFPASEERRLKIKSELYSSIVEMFPESTLDFL